MKARRTAAEDATSRWNDTVPPTAEVDSSRRVEEGGNLRQTVAAACRRDRGELRADVVDQRGGGHSRHSFELQETTLEPWAGRSVPSDPVRRNHAVYTG